MLEILKATICGVVRSGVSDLSAGQLAILLVIGLESGMHTVRGLAKRLSISKPAISRSLDRLRDLGLASRADHPRGRRSILVVRIQVGMSYVGDLRNLMCDAAR
jgi:DNA-binding MarR family transcriptional regulator